MKKSEILHYFMDKFYHTTFKENIDFVMKSQWWSEEEIDEYQNEKLRKLINHCYNNVPYYKKLFDNLKLKPLDIKNKSDLMKIPILRREEIKAHIKELMASNASLFFPIAKKTGGTTGTPLKYFSDLNTSSLHWALKFRAWSWAGYKLGDKIAVMGGASLFPNEKKALKKRMWMKFNNFYPMSVTHFNKSGLLKYYDTIVSNDIKFIRGYPSSIANFADNLKDNNLNISIQSVIPTAELLSEEYKTIITEVMDCKIFDNYGCADAGGHASVCEIQNGFHVHPEISIMEIIKSENNEIIPSNEGELVFTSLTDYAMPKLRYAPGDIASKSMSECTCGRKSKILKTIIGRTTDIIRFNNGNSLGGPALTLIFREFNLKKYQIVQNLPQELDINLIKDKNFTNNETVRIRETLKYHCGSDVKININFLPQIPVSKSGKFRFIISNVREKDNL